MTNEEDTELNRDEHENIEQESSEEISDLSNEDDAISQEGEISSGGAGELSDPNKQDAQNAC